MNMCTGCSLHETCMNQVCYYGNTTIQDCELLVIADYSHREDDVNSKALSNPQYKFLYDLLDQLNVKYLTVPLVRCVPVDVVSRRYRKPTELEYDTCYKLNTLKDISENPPEAILIVGQEALDYMVPGKKVADLREKSYRINLGNKIVPMLATYHPYAAYKDLMEGTNVVYDRFVEDVVYAARHAFTHRKEYITKTITSSQFSRVVDIWCNDPTIEYVSFDTESNTLDPHIEGAKITSFSVAVDNDIGYNIMMYHPELPELTDYDREVAIKAAKKLLTSKKVVVQHAKHEYRMVKTLWGFTPNIVDDTMYMVATLFMDYPGMRHGLKFLSGRFAQMPPWEEYTHLFSNLFKKINQIKNFDEGWIQRLKEDYSYLNLTTEDLTGFRSIIKDPNYYIKQEDSSNSDVFYWLIPMRHLEKYAGMDAIAPLEIMKVLKPMIERDQGFKEIYKMLVEAAEVFANIELKGLRVVDLELWTDRYTEEVQKSLDIVRGYDEVKRFEADTGEEYNPNSAQQNAEVFFKYMMFPVQGLTAKGLPSMSEDNLKALVKIYSGKEERSEDDNYRLNFLMNFRRYKKLNKVLSTYFIGLRRFMKVNKSYDGIKCNRIPVPIGNEELHIFPQYKLDTVATGRIASAEPSLHTLPTESEVKKMFASHYYGRGGLMVMADYAACELRVLGSISEKFFGDPSLAQAFREGHDVHKFVASRVFNVPIEEVTSLQRRFSKSISFAVVYGSAVSSVAESTGRTLEETQKMFDDFYEMFPGVRKYIDAMHNYVKQYGCIRYPNGRVRHLVGALSDDRGAVSSALRQSQNSPVQGSASDCAVVGILEYYRKLREMNLDSKLVGVIHDAMYIDSYPGELFECIDLLYHSMRDYPQEFFNYMTCPLGVDVQIGPNMNDHLDIESMEINEDGSRTFILSGYDTVMITVLDEIRMSYDIDVELIKEEEYINELDDIANDHGVLSLTGRGRFNKQTCKVIARKKV